jgi:hypothetical protein
MAASNNCFVVTPSDSTDLPAPCGLFWVGVTGDIAVVAETGSTAFTIKAAPAGWLKLPFSVSRVMSTNTTATNLLAVPKTVAAFQI